MKWHKKLEKIKSDWLGKTITVNSVTQYICKDYLGKTHRQIHKINIFSGKSETNGQLLSPNQLTQFLAAVCSALDIDQIKKLKIKGQIEKKKRMLQLSFDFTPKMAPIIHPKVIMEQVKELWLEKTPSRPRSILARKQAALIYALSTLSMRRWVDVCRLQWTDITWVEKDHGRFLLIKMRISKSNAGEKVEEVTLAEQLQNWACPIKLLAKYWHLVGKPKNGFIFQCLNVWEHGMCKGHRKEVCQGYEVGDTTMAALTRHAQRKGWKEIPTKHTGRRTGIATTSMHDMPKERILETAGWVSGTDMLRHYTAASQAVRPDGIAALYAKELQKEKPFMKFDQLFIPEKSAPRGSVTI